MKQESINEVGVLLTVFLLGGVVFSRFIEVKTDTGEVFGCGIKLEKTMEDK